MFKISTTLFALFICSVCIAQDLSAVEIKVQKASGNVYMLHGSGGNIGVLATSKGLLLVDDQYAPMAERIEKAMKGIVDKDLKFIVNTHYHGDHTGSNAYFSDKAPIFAHENVRNRLSKAKPLDSATLPVVTYQDGINIFLENEQVQLTHLPNGHTDGDTIVYFKEANVLHSGDLFFEIGFPYIDLNSGGSVKGYLANAKYMMNNFPDDVVIIPGHGKLTDKAGLKAFIEMLEYSINLVNDALAAGQAEKDIIAQGIKDDYKHLSWRFITEEKWLKTLVKGLQ